MAKYVIESITWRKDLYGFVVQWIQSLVAGHMHNVLGSRSQSSSMSMNERRQGLRVKEKC